MKSRQESEFGKIVFVCSKPLQFFNCASIARSLGVRDSEIYIVTSGLAQWQEFREYVMSSKYVYMFERITFCPNHVSAVEAVRGKVDYDSLFIECDRLALYRLFAPLKKRHLSVFEEGFGTYRGGPDGRYKRLKWLKWKLYSIFIGSGMYFGDGRKTDYIFVSNARLYERLNASSATKARQFPGIMEELKQGFDIATAGELKKILNRRRKRVALILGSWGGAKGVEKELAVGYDSIIYKPHPHDNVGLSFEVETVRESWIPAEIVISEIAARSETLDVYHFSSSAMFYCARLECVRFIDLLNNKRFLEVVGRNRN